MLELSPYLTAPVPRFRLDGGIVLADALLDARMVDPPPFVQRALARLAARRADAEEALAARRRALGRVSPSLSHAIDQEADRAWGALRRALGVYASLPAPRRPKAEEARELEAALFGAEGLAFLTWAYPDQAGHARILLKRIDEEGLAPRIDALLGPDFLEEVRFTHTAYEAMVQSLLQRAEPEERINLRGPRFRLSAAMSDYVAKVCATVEPEDPSSLEAARAALEPLLAMRESIARRASGAAPSSGGSEEIAADGAEGSGVADDEGSGG